MQLTSIKATGVGITGLNFSHDLAPVTVFTGQNSKGKTTRLNMLVFGLAGYIPGLPERSGELYAEIGGLGPMEVELRFAHDAALNRPTVLSCRRWLEPNGDSAKSGYEGPSAGADGFVPPVLIDAGEFVDLSEREREKFLFKRTKASADFAKVAATILANLKGIKLEEQAHTPEAEQAVTQVAADVRTMLEAAYHEKRAVNEIVEHIFTSLNDQKKLADSGVKRHAQAQMAMTQTATAEAPPPANCESELEGRQTVIQQVNTSLGQHREKLNGLKRKKTEAMAAQLALDGMASKRELLTELRLILESETAALPNEPMVPTLTEYNRLFAASDRASYVFNQADHDLKNVQEKIVILKSEINSTMAVTVCDKCGGDISRIRDRLVSELELKLKTLMDGLVPFEQKKIDAQTNLESARAAVKTELDAYRAAEKAHKDWQAAKDSLTVLERRVSKLAEEIAAASSLQEKVNALPVIELDLETAEANVNVTEQTLANLNTEIAALKGQVKRLHSIRSEASQRARFEQEALNQKLMADVLKQAVNLMDVLRSELIKASIAPLVSTLNRFTDGLFPYKLDYKDGRIGYSLNGKFISKTLAGAEKAVALGAISVALAAESPLKILLIDEVTRLDVDNKVRFVERMLALVKEGVLDQVICSDTDATRYVGISDENFKLIRL